MYDLIIIGAGMSGISVGHFFRHRKILLLDRAEPAGEATGKNAGFVISGFGEHFARTVERLGLDRACEIQNIHLANHRRISALAAAVSCDYRKSGSLALAGDDREEAELRAGSEMMRKAGYDVEWIASPSTGLKASRGALLNHDDARMDSKRFWQYLAQDLPVVRDTVLAVEEYGRGCRVVTTQAAYETSRVVYCLNAFSSELVPELRGRYIPLRGQMIEIPLRAAAPTDLPVYTKHGDVYWRFTQDSLLFGGLEDASPDEETGIATEPSPRIRDAQLDWIRRLFAPGLLAGEPKRAWCSTMAFTVDGFPFVGELSRPGTYVLAGLCGLGHGYAMECASWLYTLIEREQNVIPRYFSSDRINSLPRYEGGPWRNYEAWNH